MIRLSKLGSIASSIFALVNRTPYDILRALEVGQGLIANIAMQLHSGTHQVNQEDNKGWTKFFELQVGITAAFDCINQSSPDVESDPDEYLKKSVYLKQLSDEFDIMLFGKKQFEPRPLFGVDHLETWQIRMSLDDSDILSVSDKGPVVCFNTSSVGSHAIIIDEGGPRTVPLPHLLLKDVERYANTNIRLNGTGRPGKQSSVKIDGVTQVVDPVSTTKTMKQIMEWLWDAAVKPVLEAMGIFRAEKKMKGLRLSPSKARDMPTVWWVGSGLMSHLPLHAAGYHSASSTENTCSHVVSSYMPSLKALLFSRGQTEVPWGLLNTGSQDPVPNVVVVEMPTTPGEDRLDTEAEGLAIRQHVGTRASVEVLRSPSSKIVLEKLKNCSIAHFACHGKAVSEDPTRNALLLVSNGRVDELRVEDVQRLSHCGAQLAYLAACSTASTKDRVLVNETVHLATAFQLAGFRHVIGTLWETYDKSASSISANFYKQLMQIVGSQGYYASDVACVLHDATMEYRAEVGGESITHWAPFVHVGP
ncbi:hypothetical protein K431DRAFT_288857 [Polychaeton citri CBS 116435]|uniref:CHAT domain-containing protein n=1 Tax=Polychaeton citri CBS 116435 TaxID=1314669 RepID=A0A9P4Q0A0_9PEZI|nr:hypothetical protein K431DRAFT_288857 [Polychaeton citri CBS 116435]